MTDAELARFRDRLKVQHIAVADTDNSAVTPYTQEIPFQARQTYLDAIRAMLTILSTRLSNLFSRFSH